MIHFLFGASHVNACRNLPFMDRVWHKSTWIHFAFYFATICLGIGLGIDSAAGEDWPYWRGPRFDGTSLETGLVDSWDTSSKPPKNVAWQRDDLGGRSTPVVMKGRLYTIVRADPGTPIEGEKVVCLDAATGKTLWENRFNVWLSDVPDTRIGWSSCVADPETDRVYALGVCGFFQCMDGKTGKRLWSVPMHEFFGLLSTYGGRTNFPIIADDLVIMSSVVIGWGEMARPAHRFIAFDKLTGEVVWFSSTKPLPEDTTYSGPSLVNIAGQKALVIGSSDGAIWAFQPATGKAIWNFTISPRGINTSPVVVGDHVFACHSEENLEGTTMGAVGANDGSQQGDVTESAELWRADEIVAGKSSPVVADKRLFVVDDRAKLFSFDTETGDAIGHRISLGSSMRASLLWADNKLYAISGEGAWYVLQPDDNNGAKIMSQGNFPEGDECDASPIVANGRLYVQTGGRLLCLADPTKKPGMLLVPLAPSLNPVAADQKPTHLQVRPVEVLRRPGEKQSFQARLFNSHGQFLKSVPATFSAVGGGNMASDGTYTADPAEKRHTNVTIQAAAEGLKGAARIRIVPPLPWKFDFEDSVMGPNGMGEPPVTWVGGRYRHVVRTIDGNKVLVKVTTIPKGTRSRCWFGQSDLANYTVTADVMGAEKDGKLPDIGLIAQGYVADMQGTNQRFQIRTWDPTLRMAQTRDFAWKPNVWYRLKLRAEVQGKTAVLKAKVWERGQPEPPAWLLEAKDESPNLTGSPGLFGNATNAEIFLDNLEVVPNS